MLRAHPTGSGIGTLSAATLDELPCRPWSQRFREWLRDEGAWWASSFLFHMLLAALLMGISTTVAPKDGGEEVVINGCDGEPPNDSKIEKIEVVTPREPLESDAPPPPIDLTPSLVPPNQTMADTSEVLSSPQTNETFNNQGPRMIRFDPKATIAGLPGLEIATNAHGPGSGPICCGPGIPGEHGIGGPGGPGFNGRSGKHIGNTGVTHVTETSVAAALSWLARHQLPDGSWSLAQYTRRCADASCTGPGNVQSDAGGTALGLLPFLAAGQTHTKNGPYRITIYRGLGWLLQHQKPDGDLSAGSPSQMYSHGLAAIALCEAYGMTKDRTLGRGAQMAVQFIENAQNRSTGGWRYKPGDDGDTSVSGWEIMALKSAEMAELSTNPKSLEAARQWIKSVAKGKAGGQFSYTADSPATPAMTAVGLLCSQYLGAARNDSGMVEGTAYLMSNPPSPAARNLYYWYYASQVMHNISGPDWDQWNRRMRRVLVESQIKTGCAAGSWDPAGDPWGPQGGRVMATSLATLTLEVYYRYLPLYKLPKTP